MSDSRAFGSMAQGIATSSARRALIIAISNQHGRHQASLLIPLPLHGYGRRLHAENLLRPLAAERLFQFALKALPLSLLVFLLFLPPSLEVLLPANASESGSQASDRHR